MREPAKEEKPGTNGNGEGKRRSVWVVRTEAPTPILSLSHHQRLDFLWGILCFPNTLASRNDQVTKVWPGKSGGVLGRGGHLGKLLFS